MFEDRREIVAAHARSGDHGKAGRRPDGQQIILRWRISQPAAGDNQRVSVEPGRIAGLLGERAVSRHGVAAKLHLNISPDSDLLRADPPPGTGARGSSPMTAPRPPNSRLISSGFGTPSVRWLIGRIPRPASPAPLRRPAAC